MYVGTINLLLVRSTDAKELAVFYPLFYILFTLLCMSSCLHYLVGRSLNRYQETIKKGDREGIPHIRPIP